MTRSSEPSPTEPNPPDTTSPEFFERMYRADPDPWSFADDGYERARYAHVLEQVPPGRYGTAFEPGCSVGVLTAELAARCSRVFAVDIAATAVAAARERCGALPGVDIRCGELTSALPDEPVDLVVLSEVGYYLDEPALIDVAHRLADLVAPGGRLVAAHWTGTSSDHVLHGRDVHRVLREHLRLLHRAGAEHRWLPPGESCGAVCDDANVKGFVLDVWDAPE